MNYKSKIKIITQLVRATTNLGAADIPINRDKNSHPSGEDRQSGK